MDRIHSSNSLFSGMDVIIVSTNTAQLEEYWQKRLKSLRGVICKPDAIIICISEEWPDGAGNGLGTVWAYYKAQEKAKFKYQIDLFELQKKGAAIAIYHTAGKGKGLYPLTASEKNDRSAVKLPLLLNNTPLSILEAVIAQTHHLGEKRRGRLSVFWADQLFVPAKSDETIGTHHIEILGKQLNNPLNDEWVANRDTTQSVLLTQDSNTASFFEKIDTQTFLELLSTSRFSKHKSLATSLGSFSLSPQFTFALMREFKGEVERANVNLNSGLHLWMPLTLDSCTYLNLMEKKGFCRTEALSHYRRMEQFKQKFFRLHSKKAFFRVEDIGPKSFWWDFSSLNSYYLNLLKLTSEGTEGLAMRQLFQVAPHPLNGKGNRVITDANSCLINCNIKSGKVTNSVLIGVNATSIEAKNSVMINCNVASLKACDSLLYHIKEPCDVKFSPGTIRADATLPKTKEQLILYTHQGRCGKKDWEIKLPQNPLSFREAYDKIHLETY